MLHPMAPGEPKLPPVAPATPPHYFPQSRLAELAGYSDAQRSGFFANSDIEGRYLWLDPGHVRTDESAEELNDRFQQGARGGDSGCPSAMVALQQAANHLAAFPGHRALVVAVEICSAAYYLDDRLPSAGGPATFAGAAGGRARCAPALRQHVIGDGDFRSGGAAEADPAGPGRLGRHDGAGAGLRRRGGAPALVTGRSCRCSPTYPESRTRSSFSTVRPPCLSWRRTSATSRG